MPGLISPLAIYTEEPSVASDVTATGVIFVSPALNQLSVIVL